MLDDDKKRIDKSEAENNCDSNLIMFFAKEDAAEDKVPYNKGNGAGQGGKTAWGKKRDRE